MENANLENANFAGFWIRVGAAVIDFIIWTVILVVLSALGIFGSGGFEKAANMQHTEVGFMTELVYFILLIVYYPLAESSAKFQGSMGKYLIGIKIVGSDGQKISFLRAVGRYFSKIISGLVLGIGFIMVAFHKQKRGLHDIIANTYVLRR